MEEERQTTTTTATERPVATQEQSSVSRTSASTGTLAERIVYYIGGVIIALIALRFILLLLGANEESGFVSFVYGLSSIFVAPFNGIFGEPKFGASYFDSSSLVAIIVYGLLTVGIGKLFTLNRAVK